MTEHPSQEQLDGLRAAGWNIAVTLDGFLAIRAGQDAVSVQEALDCEASK